MSRHMAAEYTTSTWICGGAMLLPAAAEVGTAGRGGVIGGERELPRQDDDDVIG